MRKTKLTDNYNNILNVRLSDVQMNFILLRSFDLDMTTSEFVRSIIDNYLISYVARGGVVNNENKKTF